MHTGAFAAAGQRLADTDDSFSSAPRGILIGQIPQILRAKKFDGTRGGQNNGSCDGLLYSRCRPGFPPGARIRLGQSQNPSILLPSVLSARRFALLAEQRHSLSCRCLLK